MVEGATGAFEVFKDEQRVFSKLELDRFPAYQEIPGRILRLDA